jgi:FKBP-type peptidyl-prolyl cis-trans isomerase
MKIFSPQHIVFLFALFTFTYFTGCAMTTPTPTPYPSSTTELIKIDTVVGTGAVAVAGNTTRVHYTGWLFVPGAAGTPGTKGKKFDSSLDRNDPFEFTIGQGRVIQGWEQGVTGMAIGGKRTLIIPAPLAYGNRDVGGGLIPAGSTLVFDIELLGLR